MQKIIRYYVSPHRSRTGAVTVRGWDVRRVVMDETGQELDGGVSQAFDTKREAKEYARERNLMLRS